MQRSEEEKMYKELRDLAVYGQSVTVARPPHYDHLDALRCPADYTELEKRVASVSRDYDKARNLRKMAEFALAYGGTSIGRIASSSPSLQSLPKEAPNMNPTTTKTVTIEHKTTQRVEIENTKWFDAETTEPGQPGVFRVNPVVVADGAEGQTRYSYFNGKSFGPVKLSVDAAYTSRFDKSTLASTITHFQGLKEQA